MSEDDDKNTADAPAKVSMKDVFAPQTEGAELASALFKPDEMDIYTNKTTLDTYIFHAKKINYKNLDHLVYDHDTYRVTVIQKDGGRCDLGVKIQWLVRSYFSRAQEVNIVQTHQGETVDGVILPLKHINEA